KRVIDGLLLKAPILGMLLRKIAVARFCRTLSTLTASGVPILDGLQITARTAGNAIVEDAIMATRKSVEEGKTISEPLGDTDVFPSMAVQMIAVRVVAVTTLLLAALLIQYTVAQVLPIDYVYATAAVTYGLTLVYIGAGQVIRSREINLAIQLAGDLLVETLLVYFTGALDSPFSFLYLVSIITASMMLYRRGGLFAASGSAILYGTLGVLLVYHLVPLPEQSWIVPTFLWSPTRLYLTIATNFAGFYATAFLTSYISEKLQKTSEELDEKGRIVAALRALNQNVVESIPSGLITLSPDGIVSFIN